MGLKAFLFLPVIVIIQTTIIEWFAFGQIKTVLFFFKKKTVLYFEFNRNFISYAFYRGPQVDEVSGLGFRAGHRI